MPESKFKFLGFAFQWNPRLTGLPFMFSHCNWGNAKESASLHVLCLEIRFNWCHYIPYSNTTAYNNLREHDHPNYESDTHE